MSYAVLDDKSQTCYRISFAHTWPDCDVKIWNIFIYNMWNIFSYFVDCFLKTFFKIWSIIIIHIVIYAFFDCSQKLSKFRTYFQARYLHFKCIFIFHHWKLNEYFQKPFDDAMHVIFQAICTYFALKYFLLTYEVRIASLKTNFKITSMLTRWIYFLGNFLF